MGKAVAMLLGLLALSLALSCTETPLPSPTGTIAPTSSPYLEATSLPSPTPTVSPSPVPTPAPTPSPYPETSSSPSPTPTVSPSPVPTPAREYLPDAPDRDMYSLAQRLRSEQPASRVVNPEPVSYEEGRRDVFWVTDLVDLKVYQVEAVLVRVSEHAYWYFEMGFAPTKEALERAIQALEESVYPVVTGAFGQEWTPGVDNDPHITILHARLRGAAGYYSASDEYPREVYPYSNEREMIYMSTNNLPVGSSAYLGTLAHELQHAVHWASDPGEETWVNEGLSEVAKGLAGYDFSFIGDFISSPTTSLTTWPSDSQSSFPYYGAATLFMEYLAQRYGGHDNLRRLVERPEDGIEGVTAYLRSLGYQETFEDVFQEWLASNYLDSRETGGYYYDGLDVKVRAAEVMTGYGERRGSLPQYAGEYVEVKLTEGSVQVAFQGRVATPLLPTTPHSGSRCWWGNRGDSIDSTLTAEFDLSQVSEATLGFWAWYAIEESWDYAYVEVSTDGGETWDILEGRHASPENPLGMGFGPGYTGKSGGWREESVDLTPYAGRRILLRFEYVTDDAVNEDGICVDDLSIREISFFDDAESEGAWDAQGFIRTNNQVSQGYLVQVIELGDNVVVRDMPLDEDGKGTLVVEGFGAGLERAVVVIAPVAPKTTQPAPYLLSVEPAPR